MHFFSTRCIRLNESRAIAMMFVYLFFYDGRALWSRCMLARIKVYGWIVQCSGHPDTKARPPTPSRLSSSTWKGGGVWICKLGTISQERLKIEVKLPLSANRKLYMQRWFWHNNGRSWLTFNGPFTVLQYRTAHYLCSSWASSSYCIDNIVIISNTYNIFFCHFVIHYISWC